MYIILELLEYGCRAKQCVKQYKVWVKSYISKDKRRCSYGEPDITKVQRQEAKESTKKDSQDSRISTTGHNNVIMVANYGYYYAARGSPNYNLTLLYWP